MAWTFFGGVPGVPNSGSTMARNWIDMSRLSFMTTSRWGQLFPLPIMVRIGIQLVIIRTVGYAN